METTKVIVSGSQGCVWMVYGVNDIELVTTASNYPKMFTGQRAWNTIMSKGEVTVFGEKYLLLDLEQLKEHNPKFREMVDEWLKESMDKYYVLPESSENRQVTEDEYNTFKDNFERAVRNYKKHTEPYGSGFDGYITRYLMRKLDYKPLAYVPRVKFSRNVDWNDGSRNEHEVMVMLLNEFFCIYAEKYLVPEGRTNLYGECPLLHEWRQHTENPDIVEIGNDSNDWAMKVQEMRNYEITNEIVESVVEAFGHYTITVSLEKCIRTGMKN